MVDPSLVTFVFLGIIGLIVIGAVVLGGQTPPADDSEAVLFSERCVIRYVAFGTLRAGGMMPGFFAISAQGILVKMLFTNRYSIADIREVRLSRGLLAPHVVITVRGRISTIHVYPKDPGKVVSLLTEMQQIASNSRRSEMSQP
jgi:hypothetical protein